MKLKGAAMGDRKTPTWRGKDLGCCPGKENLNDSDVQFSFPSPLLSQKILLKKRHLNSLINKAMLKGKKPHRGWVGDFFIHSLFHPMFSKPQYSLIGKEYHHVRGESTDGVHSEAFEKNSYTLFPYALLGAVY